MTPIQEARKIHHLYNRPIYTVSALHRALYAEGYSVPIDALERALVNSGYDKALRIRDNLLEAKRLIPKNTGNPYITHIRGAIKALLNEPREAK